MVISQISSGVNMALGTLLLRRLIQYLQSKIQQLVRRILSREIHLPSAEKEWQMPFTAALPKPFLFFLVLPLEEHDASYFALSARIFSFSSRVIIITKNIITYFTNKRLLNFANKKTSMLSAC